MKFPVPKPIWMQLHTIRSMTHKVFVYGTLKRGEPNHYWLQSKVNGTGRYLINGVTKTRYPLIIATKYNIPFLLHKPGAGHNVKGEVYEVDDDMLGRLDILEDHPNYYVREKDDITITNPTTRESESMQCWVYFLKNFKEELLTRPRYENYTSSGEHGLVYMERSQRDPSYNTKTEINP